ncbi:MAG: hypothetical protein D6B27_06110 [Gammaproteobacteria bacterium]|nr:MAG: hypothetical protein D6B27_06110 [Gammaproteobacteria bacterium]
MKLSGKKIIKKIFGSKAQRKKRIKIILALVALLSAVLYGCSTIPPSNIDNVCEIFEEKDDWYDATKDAYEKWGVPIHVQMAIIHQESKFKSQAKPPRTKVLWVIPWKRKSTAYGYAQVLDQTWDWYRKSTGNSGADRDDFEDAVDFIGWYVNISHKKLGISKWDAQKQYLAYHEGHGGYRKRTYNKKKWLISVAAKVGRRSKKYATQLKKCQSDLNSGWWWF